MPRNSLMNDRGGPQGSGQLRMDVFVGARLKQALASAHISDVDACRHLKISCDVLEAYFSGSKRISADRLVEVSRLCGQPVAWFFLATK